MSSPNFVQGYKFWSSDKAVGTRNGVAVVLIRVTNTMMKQDNQKQVVEKTFIWLTFPHPCSSLEDIRKGIQTGLC